jgi:hypothetical protein
MNKGKNEKVISLLAMVAAIGFAQAQTGADVGLSLADHGVSVVAAS